MNCLFVCFGSVPFDSSSGGLVRVASNIYGAKSLAGDIQPYFIFLGKRFSSKKGDYVELPWQDAGVLVRVASLFVVFWLASFRRWGKIFPHGSGVLSIPLIFKRSKVVVFMHGDIESEYAYMRISKKISLRIRFFMISLVERLQFFYFNHFNTYNVKLNRRLVGRNKVVSSIPNFVGTSILKKNASYFNLDTYEKRGVLSVAVVSKFVPRKNFRKSVDVLLGLSRILPVRVCVVGSVDEVYVPEFDSLITELMECSNIELIRKVGCTDSELEEVYSNSAFLLHPALAEGFPMAVQEALVNGCYIIGYAKTLDLPGFSNFLVDLDSNSVNDIYDLLASSKISPEKAARYAAENFTPEQYFSALRGLVNG